MNKLPSVSAQATGVTVTTTISTSANGTIPTCQDGSKPRYLRVACTGICYVRLRPSAAPVAVNTDLMVTAGAPVIMNVLGNTHYAVIDDGTAVKVNLTPLEDS